MYLISISEKLLFVFFGTAPYSDTVFRTKYVGFWGTNTEAPFQCRKPFVFRTVLHSEMWRLVTRMFV